MTYKNDFAAKGRVPAAREWGKNGRYSYHSFENSKQEAKNKKFAKEKNVSPKDRHVSLREKVMPSLDKTKYGGKATKNVESICGSNEETYLRTILIGTNLFSFNYSTSSLTFPAFFKSKEMEESLVEVKQKQPIANEGCIYKGITIEPSKESKL